MKVKKKFKLIDDIKEEAFLNAYSNEGYILEKYDGTYYYFKESKNQYYYLIEFFKDKLNEKQLKEYNKLNYNLLYIYSSQKLGYYYFFIRNIKVEDKDRNLTDRYFQLLDSKKRVDRFTFVIFASSFLLFSYFYFKTFNQVYIFILLLIVLLGGYFGYIYLETIKKLSTYVKILNKKEGV